MAASVNDRITDVRNAARPNSARVSSGRSAGGTTLACDNLAGWPTASKVHFVTYTIDSNSDPVAGTQLDCYGIVSGNNIGSFTVVDGTDTGNSINDVVEMLPTAAWGQDLADALTAEHTRTGAHTIITGTSVNVTGTVTTDTVAEKTAANGVTIDGVNLKDSTINTASAVVNTSLSAGMVAQVVSTSTSAVSTGTTVIPKDDTIPAKTEGDEYITLAITPKSATNKLVIEFAGFFGSSVQNAIIVALFQDTTTPALAATVSENVGVNSLVQISLKHTMTAGTTSATTFKIRAGGAAAGTTTNNGQTGASLFGAITKSVMTITEYKA